MWMHNFLDYARNLWNRKYNISLGLSYLSLQMSAMFFIVCAIIIHYKRSQDNAIICLTDGADEEYVNHVCAEKMSYITIENQTVVDNRYALGMRFIFLLMGLFMLGLTKVWNWLEFGRVSKDNYENPRIVLSSPYICYMLSKLIQFVCIATVFGTLCFVLQVQVNGKMTDVSSLLEKENNDDYLDSLFPESVYCNLTEYNLFRGKSTKMYKCHIAINNEYRVMLVGALWVHYALLCVTIIDFIWHVYLYTTKSIPLKKQTFFIVMK